MTKVSWAYRLAPIIFCADATVALFVVVIEAAGAAGLLDVKPLREALLWLAGSAFILSLLASMSALADQVRWLRGDVSEIKRLLSRESTTESSSTNAPEL